MDTGYFSRELAVSHTACRFGRSVQRKGWEKRMVRFLRHPAAKYPVNKLASDSRNGWNGEGHPTKEFHGSLS